MWGSGDLQRSEIPATQAKPKMRLHPPDKTYIDLPEYKTPTFSTARKAKDFFDKHIKSNTQGDELTDLGAAIGQ